MTTSPNSPFRGPGPTSRGELDLEERSALRRVPGLSTELADVTEVEYRQLRLERVVLVGVWTDDSAAEASASMVELARLAETAGSQVLDAMVQRRERRPIRYLYQCPNCGKEYPRARRYSQAVSCSKCDSRYNPQFRLLLRA